MGAPALTGDDALAASELARHSASTPLGASEQLSRARALFAESAVMDAPPAILGEIVLRADQLETVRLVRAHVRRDGGCLLADDVGSGKTYVALAVAREWREVLVVAPASLYATWEQATRRTRSRCRVVSHELLSRGRLPEGECDGIIVDESHRFRPTSRRYDALARLTASAPVLLLSATPVQNRVRELAAQLALFLGEVAFALEGAELTRWVVRSAAAATAGLPHVATPRWVELECDDSEVLRAILALPPPPRAAGAGDGGVLLQLSLVRAWASSRAALVAAVRRRQRTLVAIEQCHHAGRLPSRRELRSWYGGEAVQLGFPALLATSVVDGERSVALGATLAGERDALDALLRAMARVADPDHARVAALRALRAAHAGAAILAFSEWATTVRSFWSALRSEPGVGLLTASEARIASGRLTRAELLARFAPRAQAVPPPSAHGRVLLLLATDLLSEGVNLQDASVIVHLDLPWNPARLAQRVGRLRRPGGASEVTSYLMSPPANAALLLRVEARLRSKLARAERAIGRGIEVLPTLTSLPDDGDERRATPPGPGRAVPLSSAELRGEIAMRLARWREGGQAQSGARRPVVAAVDAEGTGWIAVLEDGRLLAFDSCAQRTPTPTEDPATIARALAAAGGRARSERPAERGSALDAAAAWLAREWTHRSAGLAAGDTPLRRRVLRSIDAALRSAPRHRRSALLERAGVVRRALGRPLPLGVERSLDELVHGSASGRDWIADAASLIGGAPTRAPDDPTGGPPSVRALILLGPEASTHDAPHAS